MKEFKLKIEFTPYLCWNLSLYKILKIQGKYRKWRKLKNYVFQLEGYKCYICGATNEQLELNEFWVYDDVFHVRKLESVHHLCVLCHKTMHFGFYANSQFGNRILEKKGLTRKDLVEHFCKVNNCTENDFNEYLEQEYERWKKRNRYIWLNDFGQYLNLVVE